MSEQFTPYNAEHINAEYIFRRFAKIAVQTMRDNHVKCLVIANAGHMPFGKFNAHLFACSEYAHDVAESLGYNLKVEVDTSKTPFKTTITLDDGIQPGDSFVHPECNALVIPAQAFIKKFDAKIQNWAYLDN